MPVFMQDSKGHTWKHSGDNWVDIRGKTKPVTHDSIRNRVMLFHANSFEDIREYVVATALIYDLMFETLDHGIISPDGRFLGCQKGKEQEIFGALENLSHRFSDDLKAQFESLGDEEGWLFLNPADPAYEVTPNKAQSETLSKIRRQPDNEGISRVFYAHVFPQAEKGNPLFSAIADIAFKILDEGEAFIKANPVQYEELVAIRKAAGIIPKDAAPEVGAPA